MEVLYILNETTPDLIICAIVCEYSGVSGLSGAAGRKDL